MTNRDRRTTTRAVRWTELELLDRMRSAIVMQCNSPLRGRMMYLVVVGEYTLSTLSIAIS